LSNGKAAPKIVPPRLRIPSWKGLGADSEEKREPAGDIDTVVDGLNVLDPKRPIREADISSGDLIQVVEFPLILVPVSGREVLTSAIGAEFG
jgi:hypothetical protein